MRYTIRNKTRPGKHTGTCSFFGGDLDGPSRGNDRADWRTEGLALYSDNPESSTYIGKFPHALAYIEDASHPGLARRLNERMRYCALRLPKFMYRLARLKNFLVTVKNLRTGQVFTARLMDVGPADQTGILIDLSYIFRDAHGFKHKDPVEIFLPGSVKAEEPTDGIVDETPDEDDDLIEDTSTVEEPFKPRDPRDFDPPGMGGMPRRPTGNTGTSSAGKLIRTFGVPLLMAWATGGLSGLRGARLGSKVQDVFKGGSSDTSPIEKILNLLLPGLPGQPEGQSDPMVKGLWAVASRLLGAVSSAEASGRPGEAKHGIASGILQAFGIKKEYIDVLLPIAVSLLNVKTNGQWTSVTKDRSPYNGSLLLELLLDI